MLVISWGKCATLSLRILVKLVFFAVTEMTHRPGMIEHSQHWLVMSQIIRIAPRNRHCLKLEGVADGRWANVVSAKAHGSPG
jgi:hypothetical protein